MIILLLAVYARRRFRRGGGLAPVLAASDPGFRRDDGWDDRVDGWGDRDDGWGQG